MKKERFTIDAWLQDMSRKVVDEDGDSVDPRVCSLGWLLERQDRLFLITPEPELTEFEKALKDIVNARAPKNQMTNEGAKNNATILFELARKEIVDGWSRGLLDTQDRSGKAYNDGYQLGFERGGEALKDLPRWESDNLPDGSAALDISALCGFDFIRRAGRIVRISSLEKLPGFKED